MDIDDIVDVPKQPVVRESFILFFTKKEFTYLTIFVAIALFSLKIPLPLMLKTFSFGLIIMVGWLFIYYRYRGRNFDQWIYDFILYKLKTIKGNVLVWQEGYSYKKISNKDLSNIAIRKRILITMPLFGVFFKKLLLTDEGIAVEVESEVVVLEYGNDYEINDLEEQIKGILNLYFYYDWQNEIKENRLLERADASTLLIKLEGLIEKNIHIKN